ncbi:MAG: hypothetical protein ACYSUI_07365, partial [Planctomycetota bacterium]
MAITMAPGTRIVTPRPQPGPGPGLTFEQQRQQAAKEAEARRRGQWPSGEPYVDPKEQAKLRAIEERAKKLGITPQEIQAARERAARRRAGQPEPVEKLSVPQTVWRFLTPWAEEQGDTFLGYMGEWPARVKKDYTERIQQFRTDFANIGNREAQRQALLDRQPALKAEYDAYQAAPMWAKLLTGSSVYYDKGQDLYLPIVAGVPPDVVPAAKGGKLLVETVKRGVKRTAVMTAADVGMDPKTFRLFRQARVADPKLTVEAFRVQQTVDAARRAGVQADWDKLAQQIARGNIQNADDVARWVARNPRPVPPPASGITPGVVAAQRGQRALRQAEEAAELKRVIEAFNRANAAQQKARQALLGPQRISAVPLPTTAGRATMQAEAERQLQQWERANATTAASQIADTGMTDAVAAAAPDTMQRIVDEASATQAKRVLDDASPAVAEALKVGTATDVREAAEQAIKEQTREAQQTKTQQEQKQQTQQKQAEKRQAKQETKVGDGEREKPPAEKAAEAGKGKAPATPKLPLVFQGKKRKQLTPEE